MIDAGYEGDTAKIDDASLWYLNSIDTKEYNL
jgi:hypothetical protein